MKAQGGRKMKKEWIKIDSEKQDQCDGCGKEKPTTRWKNRKDPDTVIDLCRGCVALLK